MRAHWVIQPKREHGTGNSTLPVPLSFWLGSSLFLRASFFDPPGEPSDGLDPIGRPSRGFCINALADFHDFRFAQRIANLVPVVAHQIIFQM